MLDGSAKAFIAMFVAIFIAMAFEQQKVIVCSSLIMGMLYNIHLLYYDKDLKKYKI